MNPPSPARRGRWRAACGAVLRLGFATLGLGLIHSPAGTAATLSLAVDRLAPGSSTLRILARGDPGIPVRFEDSEDLVTWRVLGTLPNPTGSVAWLEPAPHAAARFFRAVRLDSPFVAVVPDPRPGDLLDVSGSFGEGPAGEVLVRLGGVDAEVLERTSSRLRIRIPPGAVTGLISVTTMDGVTTFPGRAVVAGAGAFRLAVPPGMAAGDFRWINAYGTAPTTVGNLTVRRGRPLLSLAVPVDATRPGFLLAISVAGAESLTVDADSTAQALVLLSPLFATPDPSRTAAVLAAARTDPKVRALAVRFEEVLVAGDDPLEDAGLEQAYVDALVSLLHRLPATPTEARPGRRALQGASSGPIDVARLDLDSLVVTPGAGLVGVGPGPITHLDWVVSVRRVDTDRAFPRGRADYRRVREAAVAAGSAELPIRPGFGRQFIVHAALLFDNPDLPALLGGWAGAPFGITGDATGRLDLPDEPALYVLRGAVPAWSPEAEADFVQREYHDAYLAAVRINLLAAAWDLLDLASPLPGTGTVLGKLGEKVETMLSGLDTLPPLRSAEDFLGQASELSAQLAAEVAFSHLAEAGPDGAAAAGQATRLYQRLVRWGGRAGAKAYEAADKVLGAGRVLERAYGLLEASPLETAFIEVGDPFQLRILAVDPAAAAVGDLLEILVEGRHFGTDPETDGVAFADGQVWVGAAEVEVGEAADGNQRLRLRVPRKLAQRFTAAVDPGSFARQELSVRAGGREGTAPFQFLDHPLVTAMDPVEGFAASADYLGLPFEGTSVRLRGFGFGPADHFFFHTAEATVRSGLQGDVVLRVPSGAFSGPIEVVPDAPESGPSGFSPSFQILGAPRILSYAPASGPAGTTVSVTAGGLGAGPATLLLNGTSLSDLRLLPGELAGVIPFGSVSGALEIVTPAGRAKVAFEVEPGLAPGAIVRVGGDSPLTLDRALELAGHVGSPLWTPGCAPSPDCLDDADVERDADGNPVRGLDPPVPGEAAEEGDFLTDNGPDGVPRFPVGKVFADTLAVTGSVGGGVVFGTNHLFETVLSGDGSPPTIHGDVTILGSFNHLVGLVIRGRLVIDGDNNRLEGVVVVGSPREGVLLRGRGNEVHVTCLSNTYDGLVIEGGSHNRVEVLASANGGNGVTLTRGAFGNQIALMTGFHPTPAGLVAGPGNNAHGLALLVSASHNVITGFGPIARNRADGAYLSGVGVTRNQIRIFHALENGGSGFNIRDGATDNLLDPVIAEANGEDGLVVRDGPGTELHSLRSGFNGRAGIRLVGLTNLVGPLELETRANLGAGLCLEGGTRFLVASGSSTADGVGLEMLDAPTSDNQIRLEISSATRTGAVVRAASDNRLVLGIRGSAGDGLVLEGGARRNELPGLRVNQGAGHGVVLRGAGTSGNLLPDPRIGLPLGDEPAGNAGDGIRLEDGATANRLGDADGRGPEVRDNGAAGIRLRGAHTLDNRILHARIAEDPAVGNSQRNGLVLEEGVTGMQISDAVITGHPGSGLEVRDSPGNDFGPLAPGTQPNRLLRNGIGLHLVGSLTRGCRVAGCVLDQNTTGLAIEDGAGGNRIGPGNTFGDNATGLLVAGAPGTRVFDNRMRDNTVAGIRLINGTHDSLVHSNSIVRNGLGIEVAGQRSLANRLSRNSISANTGPGIRLVDGGNHELTAPTIGSIGSQRITGDAAVDDGGTVELFADPADEGLTFLGRGTVIRGQWVVEVSLRPGDVGNRFQLHATVTSGLDDTSEFGNAEFSGTALPLVFVSTRDGDRELYSLDGPGPEVQRLTSHPAADHSPAIEPGGKRVAFVSDRSGDPGLYLLTLGLTHAVARLTDHPAAEYDPAWRPDGSLLAFVSDRTGYPEVYLLEPEGTEPRAITAFLAETRWPSFSPDGSRLVVASTRGGNWDLWILGADGSGAHPLAAHPSADTQPAWSPDGSRIAFVSDRDGNPELYLVATDGSGLLRLTDHPSRDANPAWLPDSSTLVFTSDRAGGFELYQLDLVGQVLSRLTVSSGDNLQPTAGR